MSDKSQARLVEEFIKTEFNDNAEYLFETSDTAVFRKGKRKKWYAVVMNISRSKLGLKSDEKVAVLNVKLNPNEIALLTDHTVYFPAYHMNKKHWCTIILDGSADIDEVCYRVEQSYNIVKG